MTQVEITEVTASSFYKSEAFGPMNLVDGNKDHGGWITGVKAWRDAWVEFRFANPARLTSVEICNGFIEEEVAKTRDDYYFHKRAKDIVISFGENGPDPVQATLEDSKEPQTVTLNLNSPVDGVRITVTGVYESSPDESITPYDVMGLRHVTFQA